MKTINELLCLGDGATPAEQSAALSSLIAEKQRLEGLVRLYAARLNVTLQGTAMPEPSLVGMPELGQVYWVALSPYKIFPVRYADDEDDLHWHASGAAYATKQDAREAMGWGVELPTALDAVRQAFEGIELADYPELGFTVVAHDGAQPLRLTRGNMGSIYLVEKLMRERFPVAAMIKGCAASPSGSKTLPGL